MPDVFYQGLAHSKLKFHPFAPHLSVTGGTFDLFQSLSNFWRFIDKKDSAHWTQVLARAVGDLFPHLAQIVTEQFCFYLDFYFSV